MCVLLLSVCIDSIILSLSQNILYLFIFQFQDIEYRPGDNQAHIYYENIDAAQAAVQEMRGHPLGGPDKRLRIDFADLDVVPTTRRDYETPYEKKQRNAQNNSYNKRDNDYRGGNRNDDFEPRGSRGRRTPESGEDFSPRGDRGGSHHGGQGSFLANVTSILDLSK